MTLPASLTPLEARWLAEVVRRHEEHHGPLEDSAALAAARSERAELQTRILRRADVLGAREGWRDAVLRWHGRARLALLAAAVVALLVGFGAAAGVLGDGSRPVNVVWALAGLLGVHLLSLLLWLLGSALGGRGRTRPAARGGIAGRLWLRLVAALDRSTAAADLPAALAGLLGRGRLAAWGVGAVSHGLWALALAGAAAGVLLLLATRRYGFVWETTILPAQAFVSLTSALGTVPAWVGFPVPDAATVVASGDAVALTEAGRRAWSGWLLGCLLLYGVLPRLALVVLCAVLWQRSVRRLALDLSRAGYARLRFRLLPASERLGVSDPEPGAMPRPQRPGAHPTDGEAAALVALELGDDLCWPPAWEAGEGAIAGGVDGGVHGGRLDSREQRRAALLRFQAHPPRRLLIAVDARLTPDRGSLGLIGELADRAVETRVWALHGPGAAGDERLALWRAGLLRLGLADDALITGAAAARAWLEGGS